MPILSGSAETNGATVITIPANSSWIGCLNIATRTTPTSATPYIDVFDAGGNVQPPSGTKLLAAALQNVTPATNATANPVYVETGATPATLRIFSDGATSVTGIANGYVS